ncbi:transposase [Massilia sp. AB1]|nr:transposase [Massilia sp. AB1]MBQ5942681.1 transposase [Massilia sp. AB1]
MNEWRWAFGIEDMPWSDFWQPGKAVTRPNAVLRQLREHDQIMWDRASVDAASVPAPAGGEHTGRNPTDGGKLGCNHHLLVNQRGLPLVAKISGSQVNDSRFLVPLVEAIPAVKGLSGRARLRPSKLHADRAYASRAHRAWLRRRGIAARIARYGVESRERLGRWRWVVERTESDVTKPINGC